MAFAVNTVMKRSPPMLKLFQVQKQVAGVRVSPRFGPFAEMSKRQAGVALSEVASTSTRTRFASTSARGTASKGLSVVIATRQRQVTKGMLAGVLLQ
jgi:hypothetical protein